MIQRVAEIYTLGICTFQFYDCIEMLLTNSAYQYTLQCLIVFFLA